MSERENNELRKVTFKENKTVNDFQDSFIPKINRKTYVDPQYYQHNLGRKNFYSRFRDQIRRKQAKGDTGEEVKEESRGNLEEIVTEPLEGFQEEQAEAEPQAKAEQEQQVEEQAKAKPKKSRAELSLKPSKRISKKQKEEEEKQRSEAEEALLEAKKQ